MAKKKKSTGPADDSFSRRLNEAVDGEQEDAEFPHSGEDVSATSPRKAAGKGEVDLARRSAPC